MTTSFWQKFERWANSLKIDSVSVAGIRVGFRGDSFKSSAYEQISKLLSEIHIHKNEIFVMSAQNIDEVFKIDTIKSDHECESDIHISTPGGSGSNTAFALARMGWNVGISGVVGNDKFGLLIKNSFIEANISSDLVRTTDKTFTGRATAIIEDSGRRMLVLRPGANDFFHEEFSYDELIFAAERAKIFHSSSFVSDQARAIQERIINSLSGRIVTSLTPGALYAREGLDRLESIVRNVNIIFLYKEQLIDIIEKSSAKSFSRGNDTQSLLTAYFSWKERRGINTPQIILVKDPLQITNGMLGQGFLSAGAGCSNLEIFVPPRNLGRKVLYRAEDTTGAGDASAAGLLHAMLKSSSLDHAVDTAFLMAALASTEIGARTALHAETPTPGVKLLPSESRKSLEFGE